MGFKALITLDLPGASTENREVFYTYLKEKQWIKIANIDTAWKASFSDGITIDRVFAILKQHLADAKNISKVASVNFAIQAHESDVVIGSC